MNSVHIIGRLGRDPQLNAAGTMASFSVAVQRKFKNRDTNEYETDWFNCKAFGKTAELIERSFSSGSQIAFNGHLQNNNYEKDGQKVYRDEIIVDSITFISGNSNAGERQGNTQVNTPNGYPNQGTAGNEQYSSNQDPYLASGQEIEISEDDLPF